MHRIVLVSTIVLLSVAPLSASDPAAQRVSFSTHVMRLTNEAERAEWCGGKVAAIRACTRIIATELEATPVRDQEMWRLRATAGFRGLIALLDCNLYQHEMNHVHDIERAIRSYVADLEAGVYPTREACEAARDEARSTFRDRVLTFARASVLDRDGYPK